MAHPLDGGWLGTLQAQPVGVILPEGSTASIFLGDIDMCPLEFGNISAHRE